MSSDESGTSGTTVIIRTRNRRHVLKESINHVHNSATTLLDHVNNLKSVTREEVKRLKRLLSDRDNELVESRKNYQKAEERNRKLQARLKELEEQLEKARFQNEQEIVELKDENKALLTNEIQFLDFVGRLRKISKFKGKLTPHDSSISSDQLESLLAHLKKFFRNWKREQAELDKGRIFLKRKLDEIGKCLILRKSSSHTYANIVASPLSPPRKVIKLPAYTSINTSVGESRSEDRSKSGAMGDPNSRSASSDSVNPSKETETSNIPVYRQRFGLPNAGNSCYVNSSLMLLSCFENETVDYTKFRSPFKEYFNAIFCTQLNHDEAINLKWQLDNLKITEVNEFEEQDAAEFLMALLSDDKDFRCVRNLCELQCQEQVTCTKCNQSAETFRTDSVLLVQKYSSFQTAIETALDETETINRSCDCGGNEARKRKSLQEFPEYLIIVSSLFEYDGVQQCAVKKTGMDVPGTINVDEMKYSLVATICHHGDSADHGHYVTFVKNENGYFCYDDVNAKSESNVAGDNYICLFKKC